MAESGESLEEWLGRLTEPEDKILQILVTDALPDIEGEDLDDIYNKYYGKPPSIEWSFKKSRQATVEKRITRLVKRCKPFYLTVTKSDDTIEEWFVDSGNWASRKQDDDKYRGLVGHIKNLLPFLSGKNPIGDGRYTASGRRIKPK